MYSVKCNDVTGLENHKKGKNPGRVVKVKNETKSYNPPFSLSIYLNLMLQSYKKYRLPPADPLLLPVPPLGNPRQCCVTALRPYKFHLSASTYLVNLFMLDSEAVTSAYHRSNGLFRNDPHAYFLNSVAPPPLTALKFADKLVPSLSANSSAPAAARPVHLILDGPRIWGAVPPLTALKFSGKLVPSLPLNSSAPAAARYAGQVAPPAPCVIVVPRREAPLTSGI